MISRKSGICFAILKKSILVQSIRSFDGVEHLVTNVESTVCRMDRYHNRKISNNKYLTHRWPSYLIGSIFPHRKEVSHRQKLFGVVVHQRTNDLPDEGVVT